MKYFFILFIIILICSCNSNTCDCKLNESSKEDSLLQFSITGYHFHNRCIYYLDIVPFHSENFTIFENSYFIYNSSQKKYFKVYLKDEEPFLYELFDLSMKIDEEKSAILDIYTVKLEDKFADEDNNDVIFRYSIFGHNFLQKYLDADVSIGVVVSNKRGIIGLYEIAEKESSIKYYYNILGECYEQEVKNVIVINEKYDIENRRYHEKFDLDSISYLIKCKL